MESDRENERIQAIRGARIEVMEERVGKVTGVVHGRLLDQRLVERENGHMSRDQACPDRDQERAAA
jgi:hypothetical protein